MYCNYSKDKFDNNITFIIPCWSDLTKSRFYSLSKIIDTYKEVKLTDQDYKWLISLQTSEDTYFELLKLGWSPQQARSVLPNSLKTELIMTGSISQWEGFFKLRTAKDAHPQSRELAIPLKEEFIKKTLIKE